jgi:hypothetical protein
MSNNEFKRMGRSRSKSKIDWDKNAKPITLLLLLGIALFLLSKAYISGAIGNTTRAPDPMQDKAALKTYALTLQIEKNASIKIYEHASAILPAGFRGFLRHFRVQYGTEDGTVISPKLLEAQYHDFITPQFVPAYVDSGDGTVYKVYVGQKDSEPVTAETPRQFDLLATFSDGVGHNIKNDECIFWQLSPSMTSVQKDTSFQILLPAGVGEKDFVYHLYHEDLFQKFRKELTAVEAKIKILPAPAEETPAGTTRLMITGKYEKPLSTNERLLIKLIWPNGFTVQESKLVPMATPEPEAASEAAVEPTEE